MKMRNYFLTLAMIIWMAIWWQSWHPWALVLNVGVIALQLVDNLCETIRDYCPPSIRIVLGRGKDCE